LRQLRGRKGLPQTRCGFLMSDERIVKLQPTQRDPNRLMIRVGTDRSRKGRVAATLPRQTVTDLDLAVGQPWNEAVEARIDEAVDHDKAYRYACNALGRRAYSRGEMADRITRRGHSTSVAASVVEALSERGFLDDLQYARAVVRSELARKPAGPRLLRSKLMKKKLPDTLIQQVLGELSADDDHDPVADARRLVESKRRLSSFQKLEPRKQKQRLWALLARRGFDVDTIRTATEDGEP